MDINLKCPARGRNLLIILFLISGILFGASLSGALKAPRAEADLPSQILGDKTWEGLTEISLPEDLGELVMIERNSLLPTTDPSDPETQPVRRIKVVITGYSSTPWETDDNPYITAAGTWVRDGIVANNWYPFGTKIRIPEIFGDKVFVVEDRMSWKKGNYHIDVWFPDYWQALNFGAKITHIEILEG